MRIELEFSWHRHCGSEMKTDNGYNSLFSYNSLLRGDGSSRIRGGWILNLDLNFPNKRITRLFIDIDLEILDAARNIDSILPR